MSKSLLSTQDLRTYLYTPSGIIKAVDGVNLEIHEKEAVGLIGESGCGKSMTALSIMKLVPSPPKHIISGKIMFKSRDLLQLSEKDMRHIRGREISMVFQDPMTYLNPVLKVGDQIAEVIIEKQLTDKRDVAEKVLDVLEMVEMPSPSKVMGYYPHQLSGGMQQRILIAIALSCRPSLLIADEPTTALDTTVQVKILDLLEELTRQLGLSLLLISHDMGIVAEACQQVYVMYAGKIVEDADVFSLYENPLHPYTEGLLRSVLSIDELKKTLVTISGTVPDLANLPSGCRFHTRCPRATEICSRQEPPAVEVERSHIVYCWLWE